MLPISAYQPKRTYGHSGRRGVDCLPPCQGRLAKTVLLDPDCSPFWKHFKGIQQAIGLTEEDTPFESATDEVIQEPHATNGLLGRVRFRDTLWKEHCH